MYELLAGVLIFLAVLAIGGAVVAVKSARRGAIQSRLSQPGPQGRQAVQNVEDTIGLRTLSRLGLAISGRAPSGKLAERLARAGYFGQSAPAVFLGAKMFLFLAGAGAVVVALSFIPTSWTFQTKAILVALIAGALFFVPNIALSVRRDKRRQNIRLGFPDAVDLLEVCVSSGMGLDMAWNLVGREIAHVHFILAEEMALTDLEVHLGEKRIVAMQHMAERTGVDEVRSLAGMLLQSERFGTSIADALRTFSMSMRESRIARAQEQAEKTAVKLILPMVFFVFPPIIIVLVGPAALRIANVLLKS
jgi:tight adherence protein C